MPLWFSYLFLVNVIKMSFKGDSRWLVLHTICLDKETTPDQLLHTFNSIRLTLSEKCCTGLDVFLAVHPLPIDSGHFTRFIWSVRLHNHVNQQLGKPVMQVDEVIDMYRERAYCDLG